MLSSYDYNDNYTSVIPVNNEIIEEDYPIIYIYNTHQKEKYHSNYMNGYNISVGVFEASKMLKEYLKEYGIEAIVEEDDVESKLHSLNWKYGYSYRVSRMFLEDTYKEYPSLRYFIDIHRDSSKYEKTTAEINGEKYARLLFVIGLDNKDYELNMKMANKLRQLIEDYNKDLFRGIMKKSGKGVNGIYNQDFNPNTILIEVGGQYNSIEEVNNTLKVLAKILANYIEDDNYGKEE
jgi:stage II sporulation protein P